MDLAFLDKLASQNNAVKYLLVAVYTFSRFVRVQTMKKKYTKGTLQAFRKLISRKNTPEKPWVDKGTEYGGTFKIFCKETDHQILHHQRSQKRKISGKILWEELRKCSNKR